MITTNLRFVEENESETVEMKKARLRQYAKERRGENENRDVKELLLTENTLAVIKRLQAESFGACMRSSVFVYCSYSSEAPTDLLIERLKELGYVVYSPKVGSGEMLAVLHDDEFSLSDRGIREPIGEAFDGDIDFAIVPLLAVDEQGNRLGYGGGYYDRYLQKHPKTKRIAYCFDFQLLKYVPHTEKDEKMEVIVTDKRILFTDKQ